MNKYLDLSDGHWVRIYANLSRRTKRTLKRYYSSIYPRSYVRKLIAALEDQDVQHKQAIEEI